jgi:hypothetical protein
MKPLVTLGLALGQAAILFGAFKAGGVVKGNQIGAKSWQSYEKQIPPGVALNPVPLDIENRNAGYVLKGSYLVNASQHCNFCHTCPPYADQGDSAHPGQPARINARNYMAGGRRFGAPNDTNAPVSANLTPDPQSGLPGGLTFNEFLTVLRTGRAHKTGRALEFMPWPMFKDLADADLQAIYEYLRAIPHAEPGADYAPGAGPHVKW